MHMCDTDMNTRLNMFGTKCNFGEGIIDFDELMPVLAERYDGVWWAVDSIPMGSKAWTDTWDGLPVPERPARQVRPELRREPMKAAVFYDVKDIKLEDVPEPEIGDDDVLVEVAACGICGSDLEYYLGRSPVGTPDGKGPLILGHEFSGRVVKLGRGRRHARRGRQGRRQSDPVGAGGDLSRSGNPHFDLSTVLGVTTQRGLRPVRPDRRPSTPTSSPTR